jgi:hypothetical protein
VKIVSIHSYNSLLIFLDENSNVFCLSKSGEILKKFTLSLTPISVETYRDNRTNKLYFHGGDTFCVMDLTLGGSLKYINWDCDAYSFDF